MKLIIAGVGAAAVLGGGSAIAAASAAPSGVAVSTDAAVTTGATTTLAASASSDATAAKITRKRAIAIAKKKVPGAWVTEVEREWEHGHRTWKVELEKGNWEYEVYVAVSNGKIIKFDREYDD